MNYKIIITLSLIIMSLFLAVKVLNDRIKMKDEKISMLTINLKAEEKKTICWIDKYNKKHSESFQLVRTVNDLKRGTDSLSILVRSKAKENNILLKKIKAFAELETTIKYDTIVKHDTLYGCHDLSNKYIHQIFCIGKDSVITATTSLDPLSDIFWKSNKETVNPPRKFFIWRWLQKKQDIITVEVIHNNPLVKTKSQKFLILNK